MIFFVVCFSLIILCGIKVYELLLKLSIFVSPNRFSVGLPAHWFSFTKFVLLRRRVMVLKAQAPEVQIIGTARMREVCCIDGYMNGCCSIPSSDRLVLVPFSYMSGYLQRT